MHVASRFPVLRSYATIVLAGSAVFSAVVGCEGCHRSPSADVVATVSGKEIQRAELEKLYQARVGDSPQKPSQQEADILRLNLLRNMIQDEILQQRAAKLNLTASDEDVNAKLTEIKAPYTQDQFDNLLKQRSLSLDDFKRDIRKQLTVQKLLNKEIESKINVTDAEVSSYYAGHKADFNLIEPQYHLAQILVTNSPAQSSTNLQNNKAASADDAKKKIDALHNRLESGDDFATLAANFSEDPNTASNGGDMGFARESQLRADAPVYDAVSKLKPDQYTPVMPLYDGGPGHKLAGYVIYKLIAHEPAGQRELSDPRVRQAIHQTIHDSEKQLLQAAYIEMLQDEARVRNYLAEQVLKQNGQ